MNEVTEFVKPKRNAILIHAKDGAVVHSFLPEQEARVLMVQIEDKRAGGTMLTADGFLDVELLYDVSPGLRGRVAQAKFKLARDLQWSAIMDRHGVPSDPETRATAFRAAQEIVDTTIGNALTAPFQSPRSGS